MTAETLGNWHTSDLFRAARRALAGGHCEDFGAIKAELYSRTFVHRTEITDVDFGLALATWGNAGVGDTRYDHSYSAPDQVFGPRRAEEYRSLQRARCPQQAGVDPDAFVRTMVARDRDNARYGGNDGDAH